MHIEVEIKNVFGNRTVYPYCDKARLFAEIAGTTSLTTAAIERIKRLGYEVRVISREPVCL